MLKYDALLSIFTNKSKQSSPSIREMSISGKEMHIRSKVAPDIQYPISYLPTCLLGDDLLGKSVIHRVTQKNTIALDGFEFLEHYPKKKGDKHL